MDKNPNMANTDTDNNISETDRRMPDTSNLRISHCRYGDGKRVHRNEKFERVVTVAWTYDQDEKRLTYGAAVFDSCLTKVNWNKGVYRRMAVDRYHGYPITVDIDWKKVQEDNEMVGRALDRHIATCLIDEYGCGGRGDHQEVNEYHLVYRKGKLRGYKIGYDRGYDRGRGTGHSEGYATGILRSIQFYFVTMALAGSFFLYYQ